MAARVKTPARNVGEIETLKSGSLRVKVYAGVDPLSKKRLYLTETVPSGPKAAKLAEAVRVKFVSQVNEKRQPKTKGTIGQLVLKHIDNLDREVNTIEGYRETYRLHIEPEIAHLQAATTSAETFETFYSLLRKCRSHCKGEKYIEHRTNRPHDCDARCGPHQCKPLAKSSVRKIHYLLSGAYKSGLRWGWYTVNPFATVPAPGDSDPNPNPPHLNEAAMIVKAAWLAEMGWGLLIWVAMVTGARRGELCAMLWRNLDFDTGLLRLNTSIAQRGQKTWEKDTKTHQQRRIVLDPTTLALLRMYRDFLEKQAARLGIVLHPDARIFSPDPDGFRWRTPTTVSQRFAKLCVRLKISTQLKNLRHYSATELIAAGVDIRTVAGRLGHGSGGVTTLRVYAAFSAEADQRAAGALVGRMPASPVDIDPETLVATSNIPAAEAPTGPYITISAELRGAITWGAFPKGSFLPTLKDLAARYKVSEGTVFRAVRLLHDAGLVISGERNRPLVV